MTSDRITQADLDRALASHVETLDRVGITYDGRLGIDVGSKTYGRAYRLYLTGKLDVCQARPWSDKEHDGCTACNGTRLARCSGHYRPPVGSDYLGMTKREAYETLTTRTRTIAETAHEIGGQS